MELVCLRKNCKSWKKSRIIWKVQMNVHNTLIH